MDSDKVAAAQEDRRCWVWAFCRAHRIGVVCGALPLVAWLISLAFNFSIGGSPFYSDEWSYLPLTLATLPLLPVLSVLDGFYRSSPTWCSLVVATITALAYFAFGLIVECLWACVRRVVAK